jgi:hypothetical protein
MISNNELVIKDINGKITFYKIDWYVWNVDIME